MSTYNPFKSIIAWIRKVYKEYLDMIGELEYIEPVREAKLKYEGTYLNTSYHYIIRSVAQLNKGPPGKHSVTK